LFKRINEELYSEAYKRWIDPTAKEIDEINPREFPPERVKTIVKVLQGMSITKAHQFTVMSSEHSLKKFCGLVLNKTKECILLTIILFRLCFMLLTSRINRKSME
jgi:hypothetical protein